MNIKNFYNKYRLRLIIGIASFLILILIVGSIFLPSIFYDQFIWRYFWGPIVSDAIGYQISYNGIQAEDKYTIISELIYGLLFIIILYGIYKLLKRWNISVDWFFLLSIIPFIISGSIARVLEDSEFFIEPFVYLFITPIIYFQILLWSLLFLIIGYYIQNKSKNAIFNVKTILFAGGILFLTPFLYYIIQLIISNQLDNASQIRFDVFILILFLVFIIILTIFLISKFFKKYNNISIYSKPLNLAMIAGHMIDGITSYISIYDPLNMGIPPYYELHPASDFIMKIWPPLFPIIKLILIILIIYIFDILYKKEFKNYPRLVNILKIGIFILGFAPGLRDLLRVLIGV